MTFEEPDALYQRDQGIGVEYPERLERQNTMKVNLIKFDIIEYLKDNLPNDVQANLSMIYDCEFDGNKRIQSFDIKIKAYSVKETEKVQWN